MKVLVINGFAGSGKTTAINYLKDNHGYKVYSSSQYLHEVAAKILNLHTPRISVDEFKEILKDKENGVVSLGSKEYESRQFLIKLAESVLVPTFTRNLFPQAIISNLLTELPIRAVIETVGGQEWEILKRELHFNFIDYQVITLRSFRERPGIDIRELIKEGTTILNDSTSIKDFYCQLDKLVQSQKQEQEKLVV